MYNKDYIVDYFKDSEEVELKAINDKDVSICRILGIIDKDIREFEIIYKEEK